MPLFKVWNKSRTLEKLLLLPVLLNLSQKVCDSDTFLNNIYKMSIAAVEAAMLLKCWETLIIYIIYCV